MLLSKTRHTQKWASKCKVHHSQLLHSSPSPWGIATDVSGIRDLVPKSGILHGVDCPMWEDIQVDTPHDTAECLSEMKCKMGILHTSLRMK